MTNKDFISYLYVQLYIISERLSDLKSRVEVKNLLKPINLCLKNLKNWCDLFELVLYDSFELNQTHYQQMCDSLVSLQNSLRTIYKSKYINDLNVVNELIELENLVEQLLIRLKLSLNIDYS